MITLSINKEQFSDLLNLYYDVFYPLKHFVNEKKFKSILLSKKLGNKFFPFPVYFGINKENYRKLKNEKYLKINYKKKFLGIIKIKNFFKIDSNTFGKKIFGLDFKKHPYFKKYIKENFAFIDFKYEKINKINMKHEHFVTPNSLKKKIKKYLKDKKFLAGFHTRNVPHTAHQWAHTYMLRKYKNILIQPLIGQYKKNEYLDKVIIKTNQIVTTMYKKNRSFYAPYFSYPRYGGPLEAALHAIVRKNYGCSHFWVGRDHAGYKNFFNKYSSQKFCKKNEKKIGVKIISQDEPYFCSSCNKIVNKKYHDKACNYNTKKSVSGTKIRKLIMENKKIPEYLMHKKISNFLKKKSILSH